MISYKDRKHINVSINNINYDLLISESEEEKEYGLKGISEMESNEGMFFDYRLEPQEELSYWMSECSIPLDIIFVSEDDEVLEVFQGEPESEELLTCTTDEENKIVAVIEVNSNSGIKKGDEVDFGNEAIDLPENSMFVLNSDGSIQFTLQGNERIFSRISSRVIIRKAKKAAASKSDTDYKALGRYIFRELDAQERRSPQYVQTPNSEE